MKNKIFHKGFYLDTLKRIKGFAIIAAVISVVYSAISAILVLTSYTSALSSKQFFEVEIISFLDMAPMSGLFAVLVAPIMTLSAFSYLFKRNESDFFEILPIKRGSMAFTGIVSVLSVIAASTIGSALIYIIITIPCIGNYYTIDFVNFALEILGILIASAIGSAVTTVAISVTGTFASGALTAIALLITPRILMGFFTNTLKMLNSTLVEGKIIPLFNSSINLYYSFLKNQFVARENVWNYIYSFLLCVVASIVAILLMTKRGSEWTTQSYVKNTPRHVFSVMLSLIPTTFAIQCLLDFENVGIWGIVLLVVAIIVFCVAEKVSLSKGEKNHGGILAFVALVTIAVLWFGAIKMVDEKLSSYSPDADDIDYVSIVYAEGDDDWFSDLYEDKYRTYDQYVAMRAENIEIRDENVKKIIAAALKEKNDDSSADMLPVMVKISVDGKISYRKLYVTSDDYAKIDNALFANSEYDELWMNLSEGAMYPHTYVGGVYIYADTLGDVLDTMEKEIREYGIDAYRDGVYSKYTIDYTVYYRGEKYNITVYVYDYMTETIKKLDEARKVVAENELSEMKSILNSAISSDHDFEVSVNCYGDDAYYYLYINKSEVDFAEFTKDLCRIVSSDSREGYYNQISILISDTSIFGKSYYYTFAINPDVTPEEIDAFFVKYGYVPVE